MSYTYYPMHMHVHAGCDYGSSKALDMYNASLLKMKYIWFTDHDTRICKGEDEVSGFLFDTPMLMKECDGNYYGFKTVNDNTVYEIDENERKITLSVSSEPAEEWATSGIYFASKGTRHTCSLCSNINLSADIREYTPDADSRLIFAVKLSERPPEMKNAYMLYVIGETDDLENISHVQVVSAEYKKGIFNMPISSDVSEKTDIGGRDNTFDTIYILIQSRNGKKVSASLGEFNIKREKYGEALRKEIMKVADKVGEYYGVKPFISYEISGAGEHKNCYNTDVPILEYDKYNYDVSEDMIIDHVNKYNGIFAINHPFATKPFKGLSDIPENERMLLFKKLLKELCNNNALGAALIEVGFPEGRNFPFEYYTALWDKLGEAGIILSGYGANDCHRNNVGWFDGNNFAAYIGVKSDLKFPVDQMEFVNAMKEGRMYTADPVKIKGKIEFKTEDGLEMGSIINSKEKSEVKLIFKAECVKPGWKLRIINNGAEACLEEIRKGEITYKSTLKSSGKPVDFQRIEIYDETGRCILLTNPIYIVNSDNIRRRS